MANDFITDVTDGSCQLAEHRGSKTVEMKDLALYLSSWINRAMRNRKELGYWCGRVFNSNNKFGIRSRVWCIISIVNKQSTLVPCPFSNELSITLNFRISFFLRNRNRCRTKHGWLEKERGGRIRQIEERLLKRFCFLLNDSMSNWRRWRRINGSTVEYWRRTTLQIWRRVSHSRIRCPQSWTPPSRKRILHYRRLKYRWRHNRYFVREIQSRSISMELYRSVIITFGCFPFWVKGT